MKLDIDIQNYPLREPFRITGHTFTAVPVVVATLMDEDGAVGQGEGVGIYYLDETAEQMAAELLAIEDQITAGTTREELQLLLPAGGARNALDCAYWDLEAKRTGQSIWSLTGIEPQPLTTVYTIGIEASPTAMAAKATEAADYPLLKIKLDGTDPFQRLEAICKARPDAEFVIDANQGWTFSQLKILAPEFANMRVAMIEQPLARGRDEELETYTPPIPLCADESCLHRGELDAAARRYQMINIKLDKTGGLTEALALAAAAKALGLELMVGNMMGSSLSMAPGFVVGQLCRFVDLDGPLLFEHDREPALNYEGAVIHPSTAALWG